MKLPLRCNSNFAQIDPCLFSKFPPSLLLSMYATCPISAKIWTRHPLSGGFRLSKNQICCHMLRARVNMPHQGRWHISGDENGNYQLLCSIMESSKQTRSRGVTFQICREAAKNGGREGLTSPFCFEPSPDNLFGF